MKHKKTKSPKSSNAILILAALLFSSSALAFIASGYEANVVEIRFLAGIVIGIVTGITISFYLQPNKKKERTSREFSLVERLAILVVLVEIVHTLMRIFG
ncbi:hypothetical protein HOF56_03690 [Candidatus Peribacteria bacterium]|jgi:hypothetical protein|nr:hypothetical protein [Candidatus Peribacteria bacterium]MBT4021407.1 hypothetical protein [Candidatus Peribacteria bacterium]MBT4240423.1 hypothetical protein [Candidatus Peribacteria bacterium]MBT4474505.1 hypothetical protein [Candidatus Peribacteria bacterium]